MPLSGSLPAPAAGEVQLARDAGVLYQLLSGHWASQTVRTIAELRIVDHLLAGAETADEVAEREGSDPDATRRLMRAGVAIGLLASSGEGRFEATAMGGLLRDDVPGSLRYPALVQNANGLWQAWGLLPEAVRAGRTQAEAAVGSDLFEYYSHHPDELNLFSKAMADLTGQVIEDTVRLLDLGGARRVVDVGGANGALVLGLMAAHPEIEGTVVDLPHVLDGAEAAAEKAGLADRFSTVAADFFHEELPPADYYLVKEILHDWTDESCENLLRNLRRNAPDGARALVIEALVGPIDEPGPTALLDLNMLVATEGRERELAEFDALFAASGWRRTGISPTRSPYSLMEIEMI
jgi:O-methyltransferase/methyltransferase family protein